MPLDAAPKFAPGFRLSTLDVGVLVVGLIAAIALARTDTWLAVAVAFVVCHFFLFCNVLRMSRLPELLWAGTFATLAVVCVVYDSMTWPTVFAASAALTVVLAAVEVRQSSYHGVGWRKLNPRLPEWFAERFPGGA